MLIEHHWRNLGDLRDNVVLVLLNKGSSVTDVTGTFTGVGSDTDVTEPATEEGGKRVRIGGFSTLDCARSEWILKNRREVNNFASSNVYNP